VIVRPKVKNNRALKPSELKELILVLSGFTGHRTTAIAIELLMLTFVRTVELRAATWDEFDFDKSLWCIPASRMKMKHAGDHLVPLSNQAVALLKELKDITGTQKTEPRLIFPNLRRESACMTATTINRALERMGFNGKGSIGFSAHGFRGTASTLLNEQGFESKVIEVQLAHIKRDAVEGIYNKAIYLPKRIVMMQHWSDYLQGLKV
jgi:integrase